MISIERAKAMAKRCQKQGGDCPCLMKCEAEKLLDAAKSSCERLMDEIDNELIWLNRKPATVRDGWGMPPKPDGDYFAAVYADDGWHPHWYSETEDEDYIEFPSGGESWPFVESSAWPDDWEALGFKVM